MSESYSVLLGKYNRALTSIKQMDQHNLLLEEQMDNLLEKDRQIEKNVRYLCTTILKKEREKDGKKNDIWSSLPLLELVLMAQKSLENYFPSIKNTMDTMMRYNRERGERIEDLTRELEALRTEMKSGSGLAESLGEPTLLENFGTEVTYIEEDGDDLGSTVIESMEAFKNTGEVSVPPIRREDVRLSEGSKDTIRNAVKEEMQTVSIDVKGTIRNLSPVKLAIIQVIAETGYSEIKKIRDKLPEKGFYSSDSSIYSILQSLVHDISATDYLDRAKRVPILDKPLLRTPCSMPSTPNTTLYNLSELGKNIYRYLHGKEPVEAEMDMLIRNHTTIEHGYGIRDTALLFESMDALKPLKPQVVHLTRDKDFIVKVRKRSTYIPDIVILTKNNGSSKRIYIEYETGKCKGQAFMDKCSKIAKIGCPIHLVVPSDKVMKTIKKEIEDWIVYILARKENYPGEGDILIRAATYNDLKKQLSEPKITWSVEKKIENPFKEA